MSAGKMTPEAILDLIAGINVWKRGDVRAPHKPLLLLLALAQIQRNQDSSIQYSEIDKPLGKLLKEFGPQRKSLHPEYPFWYLQNDDVWIVRDADQMQRRKGKDIPTKAEFRKHDPVGMFSPNIEKVLRANPSLIARAAESILAANFPSSIHADILTEVGLDIQAGETVTRKKRDPAFRARVLRAYEHRCAVCGFDLRLGGADLALEAAHIKWHQAGGPDIESNGLALCSIHHKMLDRGAFTVSDDRRVLVSQEVFGSSGMEDYLLRYSGKGLRGPQSEEYVANVAYLNWHRSEVFLGPAR